MPPLHFSDTSLLKCNLSSSLAGRDHNSQPYMICHMVKHVKMLAFTKAQFHCVQKQKPFHF